MNLYENLFTLSFMTTDSQICAFELFINSRTTNGSTQKSNVCLFNTYVRFLHWFTSTVDLEEELIPDSAQACAR